MFDEKKVLLYEKYEHNHKKDVKYAYWAKNAFWYRH